MPFHWRVVLSSFIRMPQQSQLRVCWVRLGSTRMLPGIRWGISLGRINRTALLATVPSSKTRYSTHLTNRLGGVARRPLPLELGQTFWAAVGEAGNASTEKAKLAAVVRAKVKTNS